MFLGNALKLKSRVFKTDPITDHPRLAAWYKFKELQTVSSGNLTRWADSSFNSSVDMDLSVVTNTLPINTTTGAVNFNSTDKNQIATSSSSNQLNLLFFSIFGVIDVVEAGASNEVVIGRAGNDELRFFRGNDASKIRLRLDGDIYDIDMSDPVPTGKFLFTLTREGDGTVRIRINGVEKGSVATTLLPPSFFDFLRLGNGSTDCLMYEIVIFNNILNSSEITAVEADIINRTGV